MSDQEIKVNNEVPSENAGAVTEAPVTEAFVQKKEKKKRPFRLGFLTGMLVMLLLCVGTFFALLFTRRLYLAGGEGLVNSEVTAKAESIYAYLKAYSIYDFEDDSLREGMFDGLLDGTGDKYAEYYNADEIKELFADYNGDFCGIGVLLRTDADGRAYVSGVYDDSPALEAGFQEGDILMAVDGASLEGLTRTEIAEMVRGPEDTEVVITVYREITDETLELRAIRKKLKKIDVEYEMVSDTIGYIWIKDFDDVTTDQFLEAYKDLTDQGMKDMIIDMRSNTGGLFRVSLEIARSIMCEGLIVSIEDSSGELKEYRCDGDNEFGGRIVVLTDGYTASASEILAGALKDNGMAITLGTTTFGKGLVQDFYYLSDGSCIKFTTNQYYTPSGAAINGVGIVPDIEVEFDTDMYYDTGVDNQLEAAIEYLNS